MGTFALLVAAAFVAGIFNTLAGGGTLVTFPALLFAGLDPIDANASSVVALLPATFLAAWVYRQSILAVTEVDVVAFLLLSLVGGLLGAILLLSTPSDIFAGFVPWLIAAATAIFAVGNFAPLPLLERVRFGRGGALAVHFVVSIYGGYFGGGIGFLLLAAFTLFGMRDINAMNGLKMMVVAVMTVTAIAVFIAAGVVRWAETLPMCLGSLAGGYVAARSALKLDQRLIKGLIILMGTALTVLFFWRGV
ncbi:MAG TPA: sulfite exporter TauE/SafE family protein [Xanthobacteraceae bacterium]|jgi:hypothetical protein